MENDGVRKCGCPTQIKRPFRGEHARNHGTCVCCGEEGDVIWLPIRDGARSVAYCGACLHGVVPPRDCFSRDVQGRAVAIPQPRFADEVPYDDGYVKVHVPNSLRAYVALKSRGVTAESEGLRREARRAQSFKLDD